MGRLFIATAIVAVVSTVVLGACTGNFIDTRATLGNDLAGVLGTQTAPDLSATPADANPSGD